MLTYSYNILPQTTQSVAMLLDTNFTHTITTLGWDKAFFLVDENVLQLHASYFLDKRVVSIKSGEAAKDIHYVMSLMETLLSLRMQRSDLLIGVGGGVVSDITGFLGATYKRGVAFAFFPTTLLAMVDAAIGGKNGINIGTYKNMMGTISQPTHILYDYSFLSSLPQNEWVNGFAEIIKHACIRDVNMFDELSQNNVAFYQKNMKSLKQLIAKNVSIKSDIISQDVNETGIRKLLNFGHTLAHAIEKHYNLDHGKAVSIGMYYDALLSHKINGFQYHGRIQQLLQQYHLPTHFECDFATLMPYIANDKKNHSDATIDYIFLEAIGIGKVVSTNIKKIETLIQSI
jgi:3-dehydroquinate synthase